MAAVDFIAADRLRELLQYDPDTGVFRWRVRRGGGVRAGDEAGHKTSRGYIEIFVEGRRYWAHRLAWLYVHGHWPEGSIDHKDGDTGANRIANLRDATAEQNAHNRALVSPNRTGALGVWQHKNGSFAAAIKGNARRFHLGYFATAAEALAAYTGAKIVLHGPILR